MAPDVYCRSSNQLTLGVLTAIKTVVLSFILAIALSGCEISPEQVKFQDHAKADVKQAPVCRGGDCSDVAELKEEGGSSPGH
jgi:hypothetical protein